MYKSAACHKRAIGELSGRFQYIKNEETWSGIILQKYPMFVEVDGASESTGHKGKWTIFLPKDEAQHLLKGRAMEITALYKTALLGFKIEDCLMWKTNIHGYLIASSSPFVTEGRDRYMIRFSYIWTCGKLQLPCSKGAHRPEHTWIVWPVNSKTGAIHSQTYSKHTT